MENVVGMKLGKPEYPEENSKNPDIPHNNCSPCDTETRTLDSYTASDVKKILLCLWAFTMCGSNPPPIE